MHSKGVGVKHRKNMTLRQPGKYWYKYCSLAAKIKTEVAKKQPS